MWHRHRMQYFQGSFLRILAVIGHGTGGILIPAKWRNSLKSVAEVSNEISSLSPWTTIHKQKWMQLLPPCWLQGRQRRGPCSCGGSGRPGAPVRAFGPTMAGVWVVASKVRPIPLLPVTFFCPSALGLLWSCFGDCWEWAGKREGGRLSLY